MPGIRPTQGARGLRVRVVVPVTRVTFGVFTYDPVADALGCSLAELLSDLLEAGPTAGQDESGRPVEHYDLRIPDGDGASLELRPWGRVGLAVESGTLRVEVPAWTAGVVGRRLRGLVRRGPERVGAMAHLWLTLPPGGRFTLPAGPFGSVTLIAL